MRITFVLPFAGRNGGTRIVATYAERLRQRGHSVFVVSQPWQRPNVLDCIRHLRRNRRWPQRPKDATPFFEGSDVEHRILADRRALKDSDVPDADVVIATWWETVEWVAALSPSKGVKTHFVQGDDRLGVPATMGDVRRRIENGWSLPFKKIVVSRWLEQLLRQSGVSGEIWYVPNCVDLRQFGAKRREKGVTPVFGFAYSTPRLKGVDIASQALILAKSKEPNIRAISFGTESVSCRLPVPSWVDHVIDPPQGHLPTLYANCDAWLFPSRNEGFGLPILEAMACRTPVIATPAGAAPELLADGGGVLLESCSAELMAEAIVRVCRMSPEEWRDMSDAAHATATSYTWDDATDLFEDALKSIIEGTRAGTGSPLSAGTAVRERSASPLLRMDPTANRAAVGSGGDR